MAAAGHEVKLLLSVSCRRCLRSAGLSSSIGLGIPRQAAVGLRTVWWSFRPAALFSTVSCRPNVPTSRSTERGDGVPFLGRPGGPKRGIKFWADQSKVAAAGKAKAKVRTEPVLTMFEHLPAQYEDGQGLAFRAQNLTLSEVHSLFGPRMGCEEGNKLLRVMHGRRVAGTLDDPELARTPVTTRYRARDARKALEYVRRTVPVDEVTNAGLRAQKELASIERASYQAEVDAGRAEPVPEPHPIYGASAYDELRFKIKFRLEKRARRQQEEAAAEVAAAEAAAAAGQSGLPTVAGGGGSGGDRSMSSTSSSPATTTFLGVTVPKREPSMFVQKWTALATSDLQEPPEMSRWERLGPATAVTLIVVGVLAALVVVYQAPEERFRFMPALTPAAATLAVVLAVNVAVLIAWRVPPLWWVLNNYFIVVAGLPRAVSVLLATVSHQEARHLVFNASVLLFLGPRLHDELGRAGFLAVYVGSGVVGFLGSLTYMVMRGVLASSTLGMSGSVCGVAAAYFWLHRFDCFKLYGFPPEPSDGLPGVVILALFLGLNMGGLSRMFAVGIDRASHIVACLAGIAAAQLVPPLAVDASHVDKPATTLAAGSGAGPGAVAGASSSPAHAPALTPAAAAAAPAATTDTAPVTSKKPRKTILNFLTGKRVEDKTEQ